MRAHTPLQSYWASRILAAMSGTAAPIVVTMSSLKDPIGAQLLTGVLSAQAIGQIIAMACAGLIIDRVNRKLFLVIVQLLTGVSWIGFAALLASSPDAPSLWLICGTIMGVLGGLNGPATQSLLSHLVTPDKMQQVVAKLRVSLNIVALLMPVLAGMALTIIPGAYISILLAALMVFSGLSLTRLPNIFENSKEQTKTSRWREILQPWFLVIIIVTGVMNLLWAGYFQLNGPKRLNELSPDGPFHWGVISAALAAGLILGGLYYKGIEFKQPLTTTLLFLAPKALPILLVSVLVHWAWIAAAAFVAGFFLEAFAVNFYTQVQLRIPQRSLGTALSLDGFLGLGLLPVGYALASATYQSEGIDLGGTYAAISTCALAVLGWYLVRLTGSRKLTSVT